MFRSSHHKKSSRVNVVVPIITFILGVFFTVTFANKPWFPLHPVPQTVTAEQPIDLTLFWQVWNMLKKDALEADKLDPQDAMYGATAGMVSSLKDPHTVFLDPEETKSYEDSLGGTLEGIGAELMQDEGKLIINGILKESPAQKAGLLPKDVIYKIGDTFAGDVTIGEAVDLIRGPRGTTVTLTIIRKGEDRPRDVTITRDSLHIDSVEWEDKGDGIFLLTINQFTEDTPQEFDRAVTDILARDPKGIVLDVRFNPGGYMEVAVDTVSEFITKGAVVKVDDRSGEQVLSVDGHARMATIPMVVLVDEGSASAAEIVAGALQDYDRATLVGTQTYGKGTVQELRRLPGGSSLKLTVARWHTPKDRDIDKVGIHPDVVVDFSDDDVTAKHDVQLEKAIEVLKTKIE